MNDGSTEREVRVGTCRVPGYGRSRTWCQLMPNLSHPAL